MSGMDGTRWRARRTRGPRRPRDIATGLLLVAAMALLVKSDHLSPDAREASSLDDVDVSDPAGSGVGLVEGGEIVLPASAELVTQSTRLVVAGFGDGLSRSQVRRDVESGLTDGGLEHGRAVSDTLPSDVAVVTWQGRSCGSVVVRAVDGGWRAVYSRSPACPWPNV